MATIKVYARVAPCSNPTNLVEVQGDRLVTSKLGRRNSQKNGTELGFTFAEIFDGDATQREVFDTVAKDVIEKFLEGYNGTIFAYGQTGTGKTYTVEGEDLSSDTSLKHGLIPQTLSMIFSEIEKMTGECVTVKVSFLEMYKEMTYDLLGPLMYGSNNRRDLPRVLVTLGSGGTCSIHGLSLHDVCTEYEARRLHLKGRCNRTIAWTSSNERSSRSHAVFTVLLTRQKQDCEIVVKSKLNLVDLAGSERVSKTATEGQTLYEAKHINLSLHHLETVILALQRLHVQGTRTPPLKTPSREDSRQKRCKSAYIPEHERLTNSLNTSSWNRLKSCQSTLNVSEFKRKGISLCSVSSYIPYRNSLLTMILQDSLGGNCNTAMIATLSLDSNDLHESISTCRFAQRVARVTNNPVQNKEINEGILIKKLKKQVAQLVKDLADLKQNKNGHHNPPGEESGEEVSEVVDDYIEGRIVDPMACGIDNPQKVRACLAYLKGLLIQRNTNLLEEPTSSDERDSGVGMNCDHLTTSNDTEEEPCSPSVTDSGGISEEAMPSPPPVVKTEIVVKKQRRDGQHASTALKPCQKFFPEIMVPETTNHSTRPLTLDNQSTNNKILEESEKQLLILELEIKKEKLIERSKLLSTALSNQRARVVVIEKHGCPIDELDNERLAEQQLRRKQAEVESHLSTTIKEIIDTKAASVTNNVSRGKAHEQNGDASAIEGQESPQSSQLDPQLYRRRKLELKEHSTRLRLLTCRQELDRGLMSTTGSPSKVIPKETELLNEPEFSTNEGSTREPSPLHSDPDESVCSKSRRAVSSRMEGPPSEVRSRGRIPSSNARAQSSASRRGTVTEEHKRKSRFDFRWGLIRQSRGLQMNSPRTARKSQMSTSIQSPSNGQTRRQSHVSPSNSEISKQPHVSPSNGRTSRQSRVSPSNNEISKQPHVSPSNGRTSRQSRVSPSNSEISKQPHVSPSNSRTSRQSHVSPSNGRTSRQSHMLPSNSRSTPYSGGSREENKIYSKSVDGTRLIRPVAENTEHSRIIEKNPVEPAFCYTKSSGNEFRSRRPATCSPALLSNKRPVKRNTRLGSVNYQYDQSEGFIVRTNEDVYRASNFQKPVPDNITLEKKSLQKTSDVSEESLPNPSPQSPIEQQALDQYDDVTHVSRDRQKLPVIISEVSKIEENYTISYFPTQRTVDSGRTQKEGPLYGSHCDAPKKPISADEPKRDLVAQPNVAPSIIGARKQQIERARRIRQVTNAVEVIQRAYRRYLWRKRCGGIQPECR